MSDGRAGDGSKARRLRSDEYTVGWICALPTELAAARAMFDEEYQPLDRDMRDPNIYSFGRMGVHNVVVACLPAGNRGTNSAAAVANNLGRTFDSLQFGLMVGIGGGVPSPEADIRLGDVVVSQPFETYGGVVQYDFGEHTWEGFRRTGYLNSPPRLLLNAVSQLQANHLAGDIRLAEHLEKLRRLPVFHRESAGPDILFHPTYNHKRGLWCESCRVDMQLPRPARSHVEPVVHYGLIASGNQDMKDGVQRDRVSKELGGVLCFEMEAAGLMNHFPCLIIRGISDYADSHKNTRWQGYSAGTAAACAKELLLMIPRTDPGTRAYIPFPRNPRFVGRTSQLQQLAQKLLHNEECRQMALVGLGGVGKTQVALEFAYQVKQEHAERGRSVFWLPAVSMESFEQACREIARTLGIPSEKDDDIKVVVKQHLSTKKAGVWLIILDNADDIGLLTGSKGSWGILHYLPQSEDGLSVYTTRTRDVPLSLGVANVIDVDAMDKQEAKELLQMSLMRKELLNDDASVDKFLDELTYLPLALSQAAAYLNKIEKISIADYLGMLQSTQVADVLSREFVNIQRYSGSSNAVATTWLVSFNQIRTNDLLAGDLLAFMSCIESKAIPRAILPALESRFKMEDAIGTLTDYAFVSPRKDQDMYDLHRLVHLAAGDWLRIQGLTAEKTREAIQHIATIFHTDNWDQRNVWRAYIPHAVKVLGSSEGKELAERYELCLWIGRCLQTDGRVPEAQANGQVGKAVTLLEHVVAVRERVLAEDHPDRPASQNNLASAYQANGQASLAYVKQAMAGAALSAEAGAVNGGEDARHGSVRSTVGGSGSQVASAPTWWRTITTSEEEQEE
ncbi:hypothetical protein HDU93_002790 [Gonapodya sp. JEL0774]|nr:hypothetical protein HDU93_002790 [Gonapodya sp. JEL0774]